MQIRLDWIELEQIALTMKSQFKPVLFAYILIYYQLYCSVSTVVFAIQGIIQYVYTQAHLRLISLIAMIIRILNYYANHT